MERNPTDIVQLKLRIREDMRQRLEADGRARKVSMNTAIVERLDASFFFDEIKATSGRPDLFMFTQLLAALIRRIEKHTGKRWDIDPDTYYEVATACARIFRQIAGLRAGRSVEEAGRPVSVGEIMGDLLVMGLGQLDFEETGK